MSQIIPLVPRFFPHIDRKTKGDPMKAGNLEIDYVWEGDLLCLWNDLHGPTKGFDITTKTILTSFHSREDGRECRGFDLYDAAKMLLPYLKGEVSKGELYHGELSASYSAETHTLALLSNRHTPVCDQPVADGLTAHCTERGWAIGFTLKRAAELLLPHLGTWRPWTDEEMAEIRKRMAEYEAAPGVE